MNLQELKETSPYPVDLDCAVSLYLGASGRFSPVLERIEISKAGTPAEKFSVLSHEIGHANCHKNGCHCTKKVQSCRGEFHAFKAGLLGCIGYKEALQFTVLTIIECAAGEIGESHHIRAAKRIMMTQFWAEACLGV